MIEFFPERTILFDVFGWQVHWYGVLYVVAFWLAWWWLPKLQRYRGLELREEGWNRILVWSVVGLLIGGRLGYVLFYELGFYLNNPGQVFAIWNGGMSSHGGFIGAALAIWYVAQKMNVNLWRLFDVAVVPVALGLTLGRLGNWINQELYPGNLALVAVVKDLAIAGICYVALVIASEAKQSRRDRRSLLYRLAEMLHQSGRVTATFLILYAILRFATEYIRILEWPTTAGFTRGQLLTVPVLLVGLWLWHKSSKSKNA